MVASIAPAGLSVLIRGLSDIMLSRHLGAAAITLVTYDWILLSHVESQTVFKSRWSFAKGLYYYIRIATFLFLGLAAYQLIDFRPPLSNTFCQVWPWLINVAMFTTFASSNWLFTLRLIALYQRRTAFVWFMRIFYFFTYSITLSFLLVSIVIYIRDLGIYYNPTLNTCQSNATIRFSGPIFYTPALYELLIFSLTAYRAHKDAFLSKTTHTTFLVVLYRDGAIAFFVMLAMRTWNIWIYTTQPVTSMFVGTNIYWAVNTILSTRVYLNLVWLGRKPQKPDQDAGAIAFATFSNNRGSNYAIASKGKSTLGETSSGEIQRPRALLYAQRNRHELRSG